MSDREQVHITVNSEKKDRWTEFVDEYPEYSSLSHLIRRAVSKEISSEKSLDEGPEDTEITDSFEVEIDDLQAQLETIKEDLSYVKREVGKDTELEEFSMEVFEALPEEEPGTIDHKKKYREVEQAAQSAFDQPDTDPEPLEKQQKALSGTVDGLAVFLGEPKWRVLRALENLEEETNRLRSVEIDGNTRYYKEV